MAARQQPAALPQRVVSYPAVADILAATLPGGCYHPTSSGIPRQICADPYSRRHERLVHKLDTFTDDQRAAQQLVRSLIWQFYADLKDYRRTPTPWRRAHLSERFDYIFRRHTGFATLDRLLQRLHANKAELLTVLDHTDIPLHTNTSENDIRCQVTKRKVSGGTRSDLGRDCRDAFLGLAKTCAKLGIAFWNYLGSRLSVPDQPNIPSPTRPHPLPRQPKP